MFYDRPDCITYSRIIDAYGTPSGVFVLKNAISPELIKKIEDEMMNPKPWEMAGEATAKYRPVNSLLEVHLDFNAATKLPPTITKETTN